MNTLPEDIQTAYARATSSGREAIDHGAKTLLGLSLLHYKIPGSYLPELRLVASRVPLVSLRLLLKRLLWAADPEDLGPTCSSFKFGPELPEHRLAEAMARAEQAINDETAVTLPADVGEAAVIITSSCEDYRDKERAAWLLLGLSLEGFKIPRVFAKGIREAAFKALPGPITMLASRLESEDTLCDAHRFGPRVGDLRRAEAVEAAYALLGRATKGAPLVVPSDKPAARSGPETLPVEVHEALGVIVLPSTPARRYGFHPCDGSGHERPQRLGRRSAHRLLRPAWQAHYVDALLDPRTHHDFVARDLRGSS